MELRMSQQERDWLQYLSACDRGLEGLTQERIASLMGCSVRTVGRRLARYRAEGDAGLVHRSRGRPSNRRLPEALQQQAVALVAEHYPDFGPTFAAEKLAERHGIFISRESLRRLMSAAGIWKPRARKAIHRKWRQRRACVGELVQVDTSEHDWLEGRGPKVVLISLIDDATSRVFRRFYPTDSTVTNMAHLQEYFTRYGRPVALYGDKASHFVTNLPPDIQEQLAGEKPLAQIGRALRELDITWIAAHSPQAKGRVERSFETAQDRLVKELRLAQVNDLETANGFLEEYDKNVTNQRFTSAPACELDAHRPLDGHDLQAILSVQDERTITRDYCFQYDRQRYQIPKEAARPGMVGNTILVEQRLDGTRQFRWRGQYLQCLLLPAPATKAADTKSTPARRPPAETAERPDPPKPKPGHPWKTNLQGAFRSQRQ
jgi:transposase